MITDSAKWHYLAVKKISALFCKMKSKHNGVFMCLNFLHSYSLKGKLKRHKGVCKNLDYCYIEIPKEESISKYNHGKKPVRVTFIIYANIESLIKKINTCYNIPENSSATKINSHTTFG